MALFVSGGVEMNGAAFVEFRGLLEAGHATQRQWFGGHRGTLVGAHRVDETLVTHLRAFFAHHRAESFTWEAGPIMKVLRRFRVWRFSPGPRTGLWTYCTVGAWEIGGPEDSHLEFLMLVDHETPRLVELLAMVAYYHRDFRLGLGHTLGIGEPWLPESSCDSILISKPYPFGPDLEVCAIDGQHAHFLWALPITPAERAFRVDAGLEALEQRFDDIGLRYWIPGRPSAV